MTERKEGIYEGKEGMKDYMTEGRKGKMKDRKEGSTI